LPEARELHRRAIDAISSLFKEMPGVEVRRTEFSAYLVTGEPAPMLNVFVIGPDADPGAMMRAGAERARARKCPACCFLDPQVAPALRADAERLGLTKTGEFPLMVLRPRQALPVCSALDIEIALTPETRGTAAGVAAETFGLPFDTVLRWMGPEPRADGAVELYLGRRNGGAISTVTLTPQGSACGIWTMATAPAHRRQGAGRALLSSLIESYRRRGVARFFLFASPDGEPLYELLGFETLARYEFRVTTFPI
jgi:ribosomal protein S18 acetylase RimI-like enzyme